jgi:serine/threonine protein kinase
MDDLQQRLERYDIVDRIAVGGMAEVFLAKVYGVHGFEKTVAIKRILPELARDPEFEERFIAEAKVAVRLSHANVVQVFDFGRFGESLFIAMEFVDGLDLAALLRRMRDEKRAVPLPTAFHIAIEIMRGLDFAHSHSVVHRDVSPSNILLSRAGEVKIADFGIAVAARPHRAGQPGPRKVMGKWRYMSPEQTRGDQLDTRSDVFSAAAVIFEIFTGEKLFPGDEAETISRNIADMPIPKASALRPGLPPRLDEILAGPLSRRPSDRPPRPAVVLRALIELSYESSIVATSLDLAETVGLVLPPAVGLPRSAIDDVIRQQMVAAEGSVARRTAVTDGKPTATAQTESTGLWTHTVGIDGVSRLEHQEPTIIAQPRARRTSAPPMNIDSVASEKRRARTASSAPLTTEIPNAAADVDRRTEVAGAPDPDDQLEAEEQPLAVASATKLPTSMPATAPVASKRTRLFVAGGAFALLAGGVTWLIVSNRSSTATIDAKADALVVVGSATVPALTGSLDVDSKPIGAEVVIDGKSIGVTPVRADIKADIAVDVRLHKIGYVDYVDRLKVAAGASVRMSPTLVVAPSSLAVETDPIGASVSLNGRVLGISPLRITDLAPTIDATIVIAKPGFSSYDGKITLVAGETATVKQTLKATQRFGTINLSVQDAQGGASAGNVYLNGKFVGEAPIQGLRLPVGRQTLVVKNSALGLSQSITVNVDDKTANFYMVKYGA